MWRLDLQLEEVNRERQDVDTQVSLSPIQSTDIQHTIYDISQALGIQQVSEASHFIFKFSDQLVVGILINDSIASDLLSTICISVGKIHILNKIRSAENAI